MKITCHGSFAKSHTHLSSGVRCLKSGPNLHLHSSFMCTSSEDSDETVQRTGSSEPSLFAYAITTIFLELAESHFLLFSFAATNKNRRDNNLIVVFFEHLG